ncbi:hypothetical protein ACVWZ6_007359 [Bradyrhizobium sp. GM6.1]
MTPDGVAVAVMIILLFPMGYFTLASPAFLLVKLDIQPVAQLLRGMFNAHFLVMRVAGIIGAVAFLLDGRLVAAMGVGLLAALGDLWAPLVHATDGRTAQRQGRRRCRGPAPATPTALEWNAGQRGVARRSPDQHSLHRHIGMRDIAGA